MNSYYTSVMIGELQTIHNSMVGTSFGVTPNSFKGPKYVDDPPNMLVRLA